MQGPSEGYGPEDEANEEVEFILLWPTTRNANDWKVRIVMAASAFAAIEQVATTGVVPSDTRIYVSETSRMTQMMRRVIRETVYV